MFQKIDNVCFDALVNHMDTQVRFYRDKLGNHFPFDFKYMLFIKPNENSVYGPGIRVREYDLLLHYIWEFGTYDGYLNFKTNLFEPFKKELMDYVHHYDSKEYTILSNSDVEKDEFLNTMTKYFQIYVIENQTKLIGILQYKYN
jgi:hypothetical protein